MVDVSFATIFVSPTSSLDFRGQSITEFALLISLLSLFLINLVITFIQVKNKQRGFVKKIVEFLAGNMIFNELMNK